MKTMDIKQELSTFENARKNLLSVVIFSAVNLVLLAVKADIHMLFSASVPQLVLEFGRFFAQEYQNNAIAIGGFALAVIVIVLYLACWLLSKNTRVFVLFALILFSLDTLVFLAFVFFWGFDTSYILDIAFHGWILIFLIRGTMAWSKLRHAAPDEMAGGLQDGADGGVNPERIETAPLRADDKKGRILISAEYEGLQISMKRTRGLTELIVNGSVYAKIHGTIERQYSLSAVVRNAEIVGCYVSMPSYMQIWVNDEMIAKKIRRY